MRSTESDSSETPLSEAGFRVYSALSDKIDVLSAMVYEGVGVYGADFST